MGSARSISRHLTHERPAAGHRDLAAGRSWCQALSAACGGRSPPWRRPAAPRPPWIRRAALVRSARSCWAYSTSWSKGDALAHCPRWCDREAWHGDDDYLEDGIIEHGHLAGAGVLHGARSAKQNRSRRHVRVLRSPGDEHLPRGLGSPGSLGRRPQRDQHPVRSTCQSSAVGAVIPRFGTVGICSESRLGRPPSRHVAA